MTKSEKEKIHKDLEEKHGINRRFFAGKGPKASTVGGLISVLRKLPKRLRLSERVQVTVYNIDDEDRRCVDVEECDE